MVRSRNSASGMIGSGARSSTTTAATSRNTPSATIQVVVTEAQPKACPASDTQMSSVETPPAMSTAPR